MAEGNITRIIGGKNIIETEEWVVYTDKFTAYAGKGSYFTADGGTFLGNPKKAPSVGHYFKKAWWSSDYEGSKKITKAKVGDTVYFQVEMTEKFPKVTLPKEEQEKISFKLYEFNGNKYSLGYMYVFGPKIYLDKEPKKEKEIKYVTWEDKNKNDKIDKEEQYSKKPYVDEKVNGKKAVISFQLSDALSSYFNEFAELKLLMSLSYDWETIDLPNNEKLYLDVEPKPPVIKEIYVRLLNYQVSPKSLINLNKIGGSIQNIRGNDSYMSEKVNMDYFSVRIDKLPDFAENNIANLYKKIRDSFLTLSKGSVTFKSYSEPIAPNVSGRWEFKPYQSDDDDLIFPQNQLRVWNSENGGTVFFIEAGGDLMEDMLGDHGAVLESESDKTEMCWIFTTIVTERSGTQPFSGHRQFGIHKDEEGFYRFFARALDRVWPSKTITRLSGKEFAVKDYLTIADSTWKNLINNVCSFINNNGGKSVVMPSEIVRTKFSDFNTKFTTAPTLHIGNIPQYKEITENEK